MLTGAVWACAAAAQRSERAASLSDANFQWPRMCFVRGATAAQAHSKNHDVLGARRDKIFTPHLRLPPHFLISYRAATCYFACEALALRREESVWFSISEVAAWFVNSEWTGATTNKSNKSISQNSKKI